MIAYSAGDYSKVKSILNRKSGVLGLSGISSDIRDVISKAVNTEDEKAQTTLDIYLWRIRKYLGAYLAVVGHADAVIFTDTVGESVPYVREAVCRDMEFFGVQLDEWKNRTITSWPADISAPGSDVRIIVIKTNEELAIAKNAYKLFISSDAESYVPEHDGDFDEKIDCLNS